jgi:molybdopterin converting factor small subunit
MTKTVHLIYYALLREERGLDAETIETEETTLQDLYKTLQEKYRFRLPMDSLKVCVNDEFAAWTDPPQDGDRIIFIPPVSGG